MESRISQTIERHNKGYNCAQAVACTYCDLVGIDENTMFRMAEGLGLGMGGMEGTCGALSGACLLAGMVNSGGMAAGGTTKGATYRLSREIVKKFQERNSATRCYDLKGVGTGNVLRACPDCITDAAEFVEEVLFPKEFSK
ncbi:MAG: C-GCAxxG-C-C family protein [Acutalibacteraceae bacterium]|nr:C-GCAxxG-C-C family protein [Acutalibacteraceae bacterium]